MIQVCVDQFLRRVGNKKKLTLLTLFLQFFFWSTRFKLCETTSSSICKSAEEGKSHTLLFKWISSKKGTHFSVERNNHAISICSELKECQDLYKDEFKTKHIFDPNTNQIILDVIIFNTSRDMKTDWFIVQDIDVANCSVSVFSRARALSCTQFISDDGLYISCLASQVYPRANCFIEISSLKNAKILINTTMVCNNTMLEGKPTYYKPNCSVTIPKYNLSPGQYKQLITMYPIVTGDETDKQFGTFNTSYINLENPTLILKHCDEFVDENKESTCHCERSDKSSIHASIGWFDSSSHDDVSNGSNILKFKPTRSSEQSFFYCKATSSFGWENATVFYKPAAIGKVNNLSCTEDQLEEMFTLSCTNGRTYPFAICRISIIFNNTAQMAFDNLSYNYEKIADDPVYFKSTCTLTLQKLNLNPGNYDISITMYPNVTGNVSDLKFGANQLISFNIPEQIEPIGQAANLKVIAYIVGGNIFIFVIAVVLSCVKLKGNRTILTNCTGCEDGEKKDDDYEDIDDGYILAVHAVYVDGEQVEVDGYRQFATKLQGNIRDDVVYVESNEYEIIDD